MADNVLTIVLTSKEPIATTLLTAAQVRTWAQEIQRRADTLARLKPLLPEAAITAALVPPAGESGGFVITTATCA
jgi:hypothetical protein